MMVGHRAGAVSGVELNVVSELNEHCHVRAPPPPAGSVEAAAAPSILEMFRDISSTAWFMHSIEHVFPCDSACDGLAVALADPRLASRFAFAWGDHWGLGHVRVGRGRGRARACVCVFVCVCR
jgi:hypothetical protein